MESSIPHIREILIFLAAAGILVPLFQRFKISPVLGFLIAGLLLGPHGAGQLGEFWPPIGTIVITETEGVHALAEMGIVFLLFMIGLELSFERLTSMRRAVFGLGAFQVFASAVVIGTIAYMFDNSAEASIILGLGFALSSTAIVLQLLAEQRRLGSTVGRKSFAILLFQDLSVVIILFIIGFMGSDIGAVRGEDGILLHLGKAFGSAALAIVLIIFLGRLALRPLFQLVSRSRNKELFMAATLLAVISISVSTEMAGMSMALGAFLAGLLLAETEYRHDIEITIEPFKGLLLGLFFMSIGMDVDLGEVLANPILIPASVIGLFLIKAAVLYPAARYFGLSHGRAVEVGLLLGQAGEFAFVVLALASGKNLISNETAQFMMIVTSLSMMITPLIAHIAYRIKIAHDGRDLSPLGPDMHVVDAIESHVVMAGYGRMGQLLSDVLAQQQIQTVAIERDPGIVKNGKTPILRGDAKDMDTLLMAGISRAVAVAVLIDNIDDALSVVKTVRQIKPNILIVARARDAGHAAELYKLGATATIPDVIEGSLHVAHELLTHMGVPEDAARQIIDQQRAHEAHLIETAIEKA